MIDICEGCKGSIYPDDELVSKGLDKYHIECCEDEDEQTEFSDSDFDIGN